MSERRGRHVRHPHVWIPMPDGVRLAARLWLPAEGGPVPAIVETIPYRKSDGMSARDQLVHPWFAEHGYAAVRIDLRGSGDSEGLLTDEYTPQEQADALAALAWIAAQPWCDGRIGMIGISWGGFAGLQVAALRPPELKAVVTVGSTDDRYADDVHYMGGCQLSANLTWSQTFFADLSRPPDPAAVGEAWRAMWLERLENLPLFVAEWTRHPLRDAYWRHGSVCEDLSRIEAPVLAVGGWADSYTNAVPRLLAGLPGFRRGLIGPWGHDYPHLAVPGPAIDFLAECLRWFDRWLKGIDTGVERDPMMRLWLQDALPADPAHDHRPGRWIGMDWPCPDVSARTLHLTDRGLSTTPGPLTAVVASPEDTGAGCGEWCSYGAAADMPTDQRGDDALSVCFDSAPLGEDLVLVGAPVARLRLSVDRPTAMAAARLNDVAPDGTSSRVSYGLLNLTHRDGHDRFAPLEPGRVYEVEVRLNDVAHRFAAGRRLRLALSSVYWPTAWPAPDRATLRLHEGSRLEAPVWKPGPQLRAPPDLPPPRTPPAEARETLRAGGFSRTVTTDLATGESLMRVRVDHGEHRILDSGMALGRVNEESYAISRGDPLSARIETAWTMTMARGDWSIRTETAATMTADAERFHLSARLEAYEGETLVLSRVWNETMPREGPAAGVAGNQQKTAGVAGSHSQPAGVAGHQPKKDSPP